MTDMQLKITIGGLLHDIGKILYRSADGRNHSESGYDFLKNRLNIDDKDILDQVRFHHAKPLSRANIASDSLAYITYMADNIAARADRRENESGEFGFDKNIPLEAVFSILNGRRESAYYEATTLENTGKINYPRTEKIPYDDGFYKKIEQDLSNILRQLKYEDTYINSLLEVMEGTLTYIPSSTAKGERPDISLYDHVKLTAALGNCIYQYLEEKGEKDYKRILFDEGVKFYNKKAFLLASIDISGIQAFIYDIQNEDALKNLRARSFYLEIFMENVIDEIFDAEGLSRTNLIYSGGGHAYFLLPNTKTAISKLEKIEEKLNKWLLEYFKIGLYMGFGYVPCSADDLKNEPEGSYREIFSQITEKMADKKNHRYSAKQILFLNKEIKMEHERECRICHRSDRLGAENLCEICSGFLILARGILKNDFFTIISEKESERAIPIFPERYLVTDTKERLKNRMKNQPQYIRAYCKNNMYTGDSISTKLWVGDYKSHDTFEELVQGAKGIRRLAVLRADIDNLGKTFVQGFENEETKGKYNTLSRTSVFSRKLSLFFKLHMNDILKKGVYSLDGESEERRRAAIVYSGGDDVFIVGAWKDILEFSVDLYQNLAKYTQKAISISAGIGIYFPKYPISYMAEQSGELEDASKDRRDADGEIRKNAITVFEKGNTYAWDIFIEQVLEEKFRVIYEFFSKSQDRGKNFLYHLLELFRGEEKINLARLAYTLSKLEPDTKDEEEKQKYHEFSKKIYEWKKNEEDSRQAMTAIYIYAYLVREEVEK